MSSILGSVLMSRQAHRHLVYRPNNNSISVPSLLTSSHARRHGVHVHKPWRFRRVSDAFHSHRRSGTSLDAFSPGSPLSSCFQGGLKGMPRCRQIGSGYVNTALMFNEKQSWLIIAALRNTSRTVGNVSISARLYRLLP